MRGSTISLPALVRQGNLLDNSEFLRRWEVPGGVQTKASLLEVGTAKEE